MAIDVVDTSALRFTDLLDVDDVEFFDIVDQIDIPAQTDDIYYQIKADDRIDVLAQVFYGDPVLWWVIAQANDMQILPTDFLVGLTIRIPSPTFVKQRLFRDVGR